jgi:hypothetical protein
MVAETISIRKAHRLARAVAYFQANTGCSSSATRVWRPASTSLN